MIRNQLQSVTHLSCFLPCAIFSALTGVKSSSSPSGLQRMVCRFNDCQQQQNLVRGKIWFEDGPVVRVADHKLKGPWFGLL